jgi:2-oxoisovalerate dehydrogenase E2 component (dihydrolipoyl transacylase)
MGRYVFKLPDLGEGTTEAEITKWHVAVGDSIEEDQPLVDVATDKAMVEIPAPVGGTIVSVHGAEGDTVPVGSELVVFETGEKGEKGNGEAKAAATVSPLRPEKETQAANVVSIGAGTASTGRAPGEKPVAAPAVRRRARELDVDLKLVPGSGPGGRISHADLDAYVARQRVPVSADPIRADAGARVTQLPPKDGVEEHKLIGVRRRIAEHMQQAKRRIPHFSYVEEVDMSALEDLRRHLNAKHANQRPRLTLLPFVIKALVRALASHPEINARFDDDNGIVRRHQAVHAGIATQTPNGLLVPVLRHAETLGLWDCAAGIARLAQAARSGKASREELSGSTISITSLGALGGIASTPIINYPEVAIVGVNKLAERPVIRGGQIVVRRMMNLSSSFDHRVVDGWNAAAFIQKVKEFLEQPATLFIE